MDHPKLIVLNQKEESIYSTQRVRVGLYAWYINIYILSVVVLHESNISSCLHFSTQNIEMSCDLDRVSRRRNVNTSQ